MGTLTTDGSSPKHNNRVVEPIINQNRFYKQAFETAKENECTGGDTIDAFNQKVNKSGVSPTVTTRLEGFKTAVLVVDEPIVYDGFNQQIKADSSTRGTITRNVGADLKRNGQGIIEPIIIDDTYGFEDKARIYDDRPTIRADRQGLKVGEPISTQGKNIASTLRASMFKQGERNLVENLKNGRGYEGVIEPAKRNFRVRKLTEKECFRLQGVKDEDFAKIRKNQSKSSCYHLAGDSITSSVLMALFGEMLDIDWRKKVNGLVEELQDK